MKIVVLQGSPNKSGSTSILTERFTKGATEAGHVVERIDLRDKKVKACTGCVACGYNGPCVQKDDNGQIKEAILSADMIVLATPLYYFGMSAQLKTVVDRFCAYNSSINRKNMKSALLTVAWNADDTCQVSQFPGRRNGIGKRLWKSFHDKQYRLPKDGIRAGEKLLKRSLDREEKLLNEDGKIDYTRFKPILSEMPAYSYLRGERK